MKVDDKKWIRFRIYLVAIFFLLCLAAVLARAYQLQVLKKDDLISIAKQDYIGTRKLPCKRGTIFDCKGRELAVSVEVASVFAHPRQIDDKKSTAEQLALMLSLNKTRILNKLNGKSPFVWIARKIPPDRANQIRAVNLKGVGITSEIKRFYPEKESGAQLIGFVGQDNEGLEGIEKKYDHFLSGPQCSLVQFRDALGRAFSMAESMPSDREMYDIILTVDKDIQFIAQQSLRTAVDDAHALGGTCVVVNPKTGEILAMAVIPEFNPNVYGKYDPTYWKNRAVTDCFEPGSTMKAFLMASCLEGKAVTPETNFDCEMGKYVIGGRTVHDTKKHGVMDVKEIVMVSSNIGAVKMGLKLGYKNYYDYLKKFGFGSIIGTDFMGEVGGFVRPAANTRPIDQANLFFGQGMSCTSLQLAMAMAAIANDGKLMRPYVVKAVVDKSGRTIQETEPKVITTVLSPETARKATEILECVVSGKGTASRASIAGFHAAGKTGTSQKVDPNTKSYSRSKYYATFVGFAPSYNPRLVILVTVDEPKGIHYGGLIAAPVFREVGQWALNYLRVNPEITVAEDSAEPQKNNQDKAHVVEVKADDNETEGALPDFKGLGIRQVLINGRSLGLNVLVDGTGLAIDQNPKPGACLKDISTVTVNFRPPI
ncbi:Penicillin-binding protein, transpeptidase domain protein [uncultured Desulfobacterium sp.]|uniref:Penicillin-binding protein, transpeptidase domain protein n=1 Tax=uncultured Desulfobacterium sp. TaxID=201089 RepID=A0A445MVW3_9BACT|nr:Penicillin-binding protein, transpeptidase domain protein [uncultured Desulfobacterium sp.]